MGYPIVCVAYSHFMLGSLLGDTNAPEFAFSCEHSVRQAAYDAWKHSIVSGLGSVTFDGAERE